MSATDKELIDAYVEGCVATLTAFTTMPAAAASVAVVASMTDEARTKHLAKYRANLLACAAIDADDLTDHIRKQTTP